MFPLRHPASMKRTFRPIVTNRGAGMRWTRLMRETNAANGGRRNRAVPIPRRWDQPPGLTRGDGGQKARRTGEITYKP